MAFRLIEFVRFARWSWRLVHMNDAELVAECLRGDLTDHQRDCVHDELAARARERA
jgi:hypothetical protein